MTAPLPLWDRNPPDWRPRPDAAGWKPTLTPCLRPENRGRGLVVVCPGGGYAGRAPYEGLPVAEAFVRRGLQAAVLDYRTIGECQIPLNLGPLRDALRAVRLARENAPAWGANPDRVALLGFSAGGHLAGSAGVHFAVGRADAEDEARAGDRAPLESRPDALVLCYAVLAGDEWTHRGSLENLIGPELPPDRLAFAANDRHVSIDTPPTFLWHTADDEAVPVENAFQFAQAMRRARRPFALHCFTTGQHGLGLAEDRPDVRRWVDLAADWLQQQGF